MSRRKFDFRLWEVALILLAILVVIGAGNLYLKEGYLRGLLFGVHGNEGSVKVGMLKSVAGGIRRQLNSDVEFQTLDVNEPVYNLDTVVTGDESVGIITLDDDSEIELGPNTMVKLEFESGSTLDGITRLAKVKVISGQVTGKSEKRRILIETGDRVVALPTKKAPKAEVAKAPPVVAAVATPSPTPSAEPLPPLEVGELSPPNGQRLKLEPNSRRLTREVALKWQVSRPGEDVELIVSRSLPGKGLKSMLNQIITPGEVSVVVPIELNTPGKYVWQVRGPTGVKTAHFFLDREYEGIEMLPYLVAGRPERDSTYKGELLEKFDMTLRWKPLANAKSYRLNLFRDSSAKKSLVQRIMATSEYSLKGSKVYAGKLYYRVAADMPRGFVAVSKLAEFTFDFSPPRLTYPKDRSELSLSRLPKNKRSVLMTWQKTNFTDGYEVVIADDPAFEKALLTQKTKENFFLLEGLRPGKYYWRVRSRSKDIVSQPSESHEFAVTP